MFGYSFTDMETKGLLILDNPTNTQDYFYMVTNVADEGMEANLDIANGAISFHAYDGYSFAMHNEESCSENELLNLYVTETDYATIDHVSVDVDYTKIDFGNISTTKTACS